MSIFQSVLKTIFGSKSERDLKELQPIIEGVTHHEPAIRALSNDELRNKSAQFKASLSGVWEAERSQIEELKAKAQDLGENPDAQEALYDQIDALEAEANKKIDGVLEEIAHEAFAVMRETARRFAENEHLEVSATDLDFTLAPQKEHIEIRDGKAYWANTWKAAGNPITWDMIHYDVQLIGGMVLHQGKIAEMATGEGKTLVATLPVYLNALTGRGVHLVTVNDYLAKRDQEWMAPLFEFHGLTVDCIDKHQPNSPSRRAAYRADITYGTNNEFGFDYLRDNMARLPEDLVQRKHSYAIVDEVDSVLIDDARTPLIISGPIPKGKDQEAFVQLRPKVEQLVAEQRKIVTSVLADARKKIAEGDSKEGGFMLLRAFRGLPKNKALIKFLSEEGIKTLLQKTENFYLQDQGKEMHKVDEALLFTIDEKQNSIELTERGIELLSGAESPDLFILPDIATNLDQIEKMPGSDEDRAHKKDELLRDYSVKSERIHTLNQLLKAYTLFEKDVEYVLMDGKVKIVDEQTGRIMEGRRYSDGLHQAIEAKEQVKIEDATQTFATITLQNYFRMYDKLSGMTGTAETEAGEFWDIYELDVVVIPTNRPIARDDRFDLVYKTKREKYNAVVDEIVALTEAKRPVLVGTTSVEISELLSRMLKMRKIDHQVLNAKLHKKEADIVADAGKPGAVTIATNMAGRGTDIKISQEVKDAGGLAIIGTERHDSRRVDRQLRGRAGRQGDPGSSQFFVSLEDHLMRLFGSERIAKLMDRMGLEEGEVIQHSMINKSIERAQRKVEENNFGIRKRLLEYDDVMNAQREVIYKRRRHALFGDRLSVDIGNMLHDTIDELVNTYHAAKDFDGFKLDLIRAFAFNPPMETEDFMRKSADEVTNELYHSAQKVYTAKKLGIATEALPVLKNVWTERGATVKNISVPFTDGQRALNIVTQLERSVETGGASLMESFEKGITLAMIDEAWKEHLREMDDLKQSVQGAVYEQKDPLLIYKFESFELFKGMISKLNRDIISFLFKGALPQQDPQTQMRAASPPPKLDMDKMKVSRPEMATSRATKTSTRTNEVNGGVRAPQRPSAPVVAGPKIGRNEKVTIRNLQTGETKSLKYKVAKPLLDEAGWILIEES